MDGVFINLTDNDVIVRDINGKELIIKYIKEICTPSRYEAHDDIMVCTETSTEKYVIRCVPRSKYVKYTFTDVQIEKINEISCRKTRLFIMSEEDADCWSSGSFKCPFRNYRIFTVSKDGNHLTEYPRPITYLDTFVNSTSFLYTASKRFIASETKV